MFNENRRFGFRKLSFGLAGVLIGLSLAGAKQVKADAIKSNDNLASTQTNVYVQQKQEQASQQKVQPARVIEHIKPSAKVDAKPAQALITTRVSLHEPSEQSEQVNDGQLAVKQGQNNRVYSQSLAEQPVQHDKLYVDPDNKNGSVQPDENGNIPGTKIAFPKDLGVNFYNPYNAGVNKLTQNYIRYIDYENPITGNTYHIYSKTIHFKRIATLNIAPDKKSVSVSYSNWIPANDSIGKTNFDKVVLPQFNGYIPYYSWGDANYPIAVFPAISINPNKPNEDTGLFGENKSAKDSYTTGSFNGMIHYAKKLTYKVFGLDNTGNTYWANNEGLISDSNGNFPLTNIKFPKELTKDNIQNSLQHSITITFNVHMPDGSTKIVHPVGYLNGKSRYITSRDATMTIDGGSQKASVEFTPWHMRYGGESVNTDLPKIKGYDAYVNNQLSDFNRYSFVIPRQNPKFTYSFDVTYKPHIRMFHPDRPERPQHKDLNQPLVWNIEIVNPDGTVTRQQQVINATRTGYLNEATGQVTYSHWQIDKNAFAGVNLPSFTGYVPVVNGKQVSGLTAPAVDINDIRTAIDDDNTITTRVTYQKKSSSDTADVPPAQTHAKPGSKPVITEVPLYEPSGLNKAAGNADQLVLNQDFDWESFFKNLPRFNRKDYVVINGKKHKKYSKVVVHIGLEGRCKPVTATAML